MFESRRKQPDGPVIIVNNETYRSPEDMPEGARAIWDYYAREMEQQGIDWRQQNRIVLTWSREGNIARQSIRIERGSGDFRWPGKLGGLRHHLEPKRGPPRRVAVLVYLLCWLSLGAYAIFHRQPALIRASASIWLQLSFGLLCAPWLLAAGYAYLERRRPSVVPTSEVDDRTTWWRSSGNPFVDSRASGWKWFNRTLGALIGLLALSYFAAFIGVAKLLHYTERQPGEATVTIAMKHVHSGRSGRCIPRLEFKELRVLADQLCVSATFFNQVKVGDQIRITGKVSRYGIEPDNLEVSSEYTP